MIERFRLIDGGKILEANIHVEDPGAFTMPWDAIQRFRLFEEVVSKMPVERIPLLSTPAEGPLTEAICAEVLDDPATAGGVLLKVMARGPFQEGQQCWIVDRDGSKIGATVENVFKQTIDSEVTLSTVLPA